MSEKRASLSLALAAVLLACRVCSTLQLPTLSSGSSALAAAPEFGNLGNLLRNLQREADPRVPKAPALFIRELNQSTLKGITPTIIVGCVGCPCDLCGHLGLNRLGEFAPVESAIYGHILRGSCGQQEKLVIDVGGNIGYFALLAAAYGCRVVAFEPQERPREMLTASLSLNAHGKHVRVHPFAIGATQGTGHIQKGAQWGQSGVRRAFLLRHRTAADASGDVHFRTLGSIVEEDALLLKIDTEGYESNVMEGSYAYLHSHSVQHIVMEVKLANTQFKRDLLRRVMTEAHMQHVYNYHEDYSHAEFHQRGSNLSGFVVDVTQAVLGGNMSASFTEDFWFTRAPLDLANM